MIDLLRLAAIFVVVTLSLIAYMVLPGVLWPRRIGLAVAKASAEPRRALLLGLVNVLFFATVLLGLLALASRFENTVIGAALLLLALVVALVLGLLLSLGLSAMTYLVGERLQPHAIRPRQSILAASLLVFACLTPLLGWLILFPYVIGLGTGAVILSLFHRDQP